MRLAYLQYRLPLLTILDAMLDTCILNAVYNEHSATTEGLGARYEFGAAVF